jgi:hypothetical protein
MAEHVFTERYCLGCRKPGHFTNECWSTQALNTPEARELMRLCRAANAAPTPPAPQAMPPVTLPPLPER